MANVTFNNATIKPRGDTASNWSSVNPTLAKNELGYDETNKKFKIGDGTTPWNSLSYIEGSPQTVIELDGIMDIFSGEYPEINFRASDWEQFVNNKYSNISLSIEYSEIERAETVLFSLEHLIDNEDGSWYAYYRYEYEAKKNYKLAIYWSEDDMYIDEFYEEGISSSVSLEPIVLSGSIDWENGGNTLEFTEEKYQQFLKNKTAPVVIEDTTYILSFYMESDSECYCTYQRITPEKIYKLSIGWNSTNYGYSDVQYVKEIGSSVNLEPINTDGIFTGWEDDFGIDITLTDENYQQFLKNKLAPIRIDTQIFQLDTLSHGDNNSYCAQYYVINGTYKYAVSINWEEDNSYCEEIFYEYLSTQVSYNPTITEGTKIGTITIDGVETNLYAPEGGNSGDSFQITVNKANIEDLQGITERHENRIQTLEDSNKESIDLSNYVDLNSEQYVSNKFLTTNIQIGEATVVSAGGLTIAGVLKDKNNTAGKSGQILSSTDFGVEWKSIELGSSSCTKITDEVYFYDFVHIYIASNTPDGNYIIAGQDAAGMFFQTVVTISSGAVSLNFVVDGSVELSYDCALVAPNIYKNIEKVEVGVGIAVTPTESVYFVNYTSTSENADSFILDVNPFIAPLDERITALENNSGTSSGGGLNIYPLGRILNFDNPTISITNSQVVEIKNANAISCGVEVPGLGQCGVILYICSNATNYICFTDAMFIIEGQRFYVRRAYIDVAALTLNFTPDA